MRQPRLYDQNIGPVFYQILIIAACTLLFLEIPPIIYGYLSYRQFEYFSLSGYMPYEEVMIALRSGNLANILAAPLISLNMTSGHMFSNIYSFTIGPLIASIVLGLLTGIAIIMKLRMRLIGRHAATQGAGIVSLGLLATIGASSAGLLGCHGGSGMSGGILKIIGISQESAAFLAFWSPYIQLVLIAALGLYCLHLYRTLNRPKELARLSLG